jgi:surface antigen
LAFTHVVLSRVRGAAGAKPAIKTATKTALRTLAVLGGIAAFSVVGMQAGGNTAHAAPGLTYHYGLYVDNGWLCRGWSNGAYHCTQHWYRDRAGNLVSLNQPWVPTGAGVAASTGAGQASAPAAPNNVSWGTTSAPAGISQWAYTGHPAWAMGDFAGDPNAAFFGSCTWWAQYKRMDERLMGLGNAAQWAWNAPGVGLRTGSTPAVGATVVFQPGVQGASGLGHTGHVEAVYANGWFLESAMSTYWNGGGWGRVSYVYAHAGYGVTFIY